MANRARRAARRPKKPTAGPRLDRRYREELEARKLRSVAQLLFKCARLLNERAIAGMRERTNIASLRSTHTSLLPHIDLDGTRLTTLALRLGVSKQAAAELVDELEALGVLEKAPDPRDGRAKLIRFTARGRRGLLDGLAVLGELEHEMEGTLGAPRMRALHDTLIRLETWLSDRASEATPC